jgi:Protein of unknown function (DUF3224)
MLGHESQSYEASENAMTETAKATGAVAMRSWEEEVYAEVEGAPKLSHDRVGHSFTGDIEGEGTAQFLNAYRDEATATYTGYERVVGRLAGRSGSFVLEVAGRYEDGTATTTWSVVPGSGTGALAGLRGEGGYVSRMDGSEPYRLVYRFE